MYYYFFSLKLKSGLRGYTNDDGAADKAIDMLKSLVRFDFETIDLSKPMGYAPLNDVYRLWHSGEESTTHDDEAYNSSSLYK